MRLDVDTKQRMKGAATFMLEFYKILMGTFLTVFVPHACADGRICSFSHNLYENHDSFHQVAVGTNAACFFAFLMMYVIEVRRENWCITYLDIDPSLPIENLDTEIERDAYKPYKRRMATLNQNYQNAVLTCSVAHCTNIGVSMIDIVRNWPGMPALAPLASYIILVSMKLYNSQSIASASLSKERAFSAYLSGPKTYNTIDADYKLRPEIELLETGTGEETKEDDQELVTSPEEDTELSIENVIIDEESNKV
tara:strand:+ start:596 stop:1354 length:759 start_codon:yes stop_codon:yes gene_type:complete